jgi:hypothetical protein
MGFKDDYCWRRAEDYARRAQEATDEDVREFFHRLRDNWISLANRNEFLDYEHRKIDAFGVLR